MRFWQAVLVMFLLVFAAACSPAGNGIVVRVETEQPAATATSDAAPTTPAIVEATTAPTEAATQPPAHALAGLVYTIGAGNGLWRINASGQAELLTDQYTPVLSPDQTRVAFSPAYEGEIWVKELPDGLGRNLTNTGNLLEEGLQWWPGHTDLIVFTGRSPEGGIASTALGVIRADGTGYRLLETELGSISLPALSPDAQTLAVDRAAQPWLYRLNGEREALDVAAFGLQFDKAAHPAWSPDGQQLAWKVYATPEGGASWSAVAVLDMAAGTGRLLHQYTLLGGSEIWAELAWSPDGQWLAVVNQAELPSGQASLWALRLDGQEEHYLGDYASAPVWSPDSASLVFTQLPDGASAFDAAQVIRVEVGEWVPRPLDLPGGAQAQAWLPLPEGAPADRPAAP